MLHLILFLFWANASDVLAQTMVWQEWEHQASFGGKLRLQSDLSFRNFFSDQHLQVFARSSLEYGNAERFIGLGVLATDKDFAIKGPWERRIFLKTQISNSLKAWNIKHLLRPEYSQMGDVRNVRLRYMQTWQHALPFHEQDWVLSIGDEITLDALGGLFGMNRISISMEQSFGAAFKMQFQYIYQISESKAGQSMEPMHILRLQLRFKTLPRPA